MQMRRFSPHTATSSKSFHPYVALFMALMSGATVLATPTASLGKLSYDSATRRLTATYSLDADAIVTFDVQTNGVSIGAENLWYFTGDVNKAVDAGPSRSFVWDAGKSWPEGNVAANGLAVELTAWARLSPPDYLVACVTVPSNVWYFATSNAVPGGLLDIRNKTEFLVMRKIPAKGVVWRMGSPADEPSHDATWSCDKLTKVKLTHDYYIGIYPVTAQQHLSVVRSECGFTKSKTWRARAAAGVSYNTIRGTSAGAGWPNDDSDVAHAVDANSAIDRFRVRTGLNLDLPTEAEWEYACRAGCATGYYDGTEAKANQYSSNFNRLGRYAGNACANPESATEPEDGGTSVVGSYMPNAWGLYDMLGNVREWCLDYWYPQSADDLVTVRVDPIGATYEQSQTATDGKNVVHSGNRVVRGGSYYDTAYLVRCANRGYSSPSASWNTQGYRLSLVIK